ncbi:MAG: aldehyde oxidase [Deltaproteobacteria bacterium]|nr:MAG: aldehyde oxidase [Deltaproteobacteria bacterium]
MTNHYKQVGHSIPKIGITERLTGAPVFSADINLRNPLILRVLRSRRHHARIRSIDTTAARTIDGVVAIFTAKDIPGKNAHGIINKDQPLLMGDKVRSLSDPVALVAAKTDTAARKALDRIKVDYDDLPAVFTPEDAMAPDAPAIHDKGNILFTRKIKRGDPETAFKACAVVVEKTYRTTRIEHAFLEPDAGAGYVDDDGTLVIFASTQNPHYDHQAVVSILGLEKDRVRIIQTATGGGFGSKLDLNVQGFIGLALYHLKQPVRMIYSREESFLATAKRHPLTMTLKTGADKQGRLIATRATIICDTGAYASYGIPVASRSAVHATGPYEIEHVDIESHCVYTNNPFSGAMRGFGTPQMAIAHESQMDLIAAQLDIDPLEIRKINALSVGSVTSTGQKLTASVGIGECLDRLGPYYEQARNEWLKEGDIPYRKKGIGIGGMWYGIGNTGTKNPSTAKIKLTPDGRLTLYTGAADIGQGSSTVLAQIAAEVLGITAESLHLVVADTQRTTSAGATSASRQTYISGNAVHIAATACASALIAEAAALLDLPASALVLSDGNVIEAAGSTRRVDFARLASRLLEKKKPLEWHGVFDPDTTALDPETGQGVPYATYAYAAQLVLLSVDTLTGEVFVEKVFAAHDVGKAIHPENVIGQICGGVVMGLGFALMEEYTPEETDSLKDYHVPTCADLPDIVPIIVEAPEPTGPFGAKGVGEPALIPTAPAVINALAHALGKRIYQLPASLEKVLAVSIETGHYGPKEA